MKRNVARLILCVIIVLISGEIQAMKRDTLIVSADFYHSWPIKENDFLSPGFYRPIVNPGLEVLYYNKAAKKGKFWTGLFYQRSRFGARNVSLGRFRIQELSVPVVYKHPFSIGKWKYVFSTGVYNGLLIKCSTDGYFSYGWNEKKKEDFYNYSSDIFFTDLYVDLGCPLIGNLGHFNLAAYFKYRLNGTWVNHYDRNIYLGVKLSYLIKLK